MTCQHTRTWLLDDPAQAERHLTECAACRAFAAQARQLEQAWRDLPLPASAETARLAFLANVPTPAAVPCPPARRRAVADRWLVPALLCVGLGLATWLLAPTPQATAAPAVLEQLIDWNLQLTQAPSLTERNQLYTSRQAAFQGAVTRGRLPAEEQELAQLLLVNGSWLATHDDPLAEAEQFSAVADNLVGHIEKAARGKDRAALQRYARLQEQVARRGVSAKLAKAEETGVLNFEHERRLEKVVLRDSKRMKQLVELLERQPDLKRKSVRQALNLPAKAPRGTADVLFALAATESARVGTPLTCRVRVANHGATPLNKVQLFVTLPEGLVWLGPRGPHGARQEGSYLVFRPLPALAVGQEHIFEVRVRPEQAGELTLQAELRAKQLGYRPLVREINVSVLDSGR